MRSSPTQLMIILMLSLGANAFARVGKTSEQYWREADMRLDYLISDYFISLENCNKSFEGFHACASALNAIATTASPKLEVLPAAAVGDPAVHTGPERFKLPSGFVLTEAIPTSPAKISLRLMQEQKVARDAALKKAEQDLFNRKPVVKVDFPAEIRTVIDQAKIDKDDLPAAAAVALTAYVRIAIDPHSRVKPVQELKDESDDANTEFYGIGAVIQELDDKMVVGNILPGSAALKYGLMSKDILVKINGIPVEKQSQIDIVNQIRGPESTKVVLSVIRDGVAKDIAIVRERVMQENVVISTQELLGANYLVIKIISFVDNNACNKIEARIAEDTAKDPSIVGLIVDLRNDIGGILPQAICIGSLFVGTNKTIVKIKDLKQNAFEIHQGQRAQVSQLPLATVINSDSASASEVLAGALQDYQRAWIVGDTSFGKATVQYPDNLTDKIFLYKTTSRYYLPSGRTNQVVGITPDFKVPARPNMTPDQLFTLHESDVFPMGLGAEGDPWVQPRPADFNRIQICRGAQAAEAAYNKAKGASDYQLLVSAEVLACDAKTAVPAVSP